MKDMVEALGIETLNVVKRGQVDAFVRHDPFQHAFFTKEIVEEGLADFHLTIKSGLDTKTKRRLISDVINSWDEKGEPITDL